MKEHSRRDSSGERTICIVQARMGSRRFPGKVLRPLCGKPVLGWVIDRLGRSVKSDGMVIATSENPADVEIADFAKGVGVPCFRGSEADVLGRFLQAAEAFDAARVVRVNADNPLVDPFYVDRLVDAMKGSPMDYISYRLRDGTPVMLTALSFFAEIMTFDCLRRAGATIADPSEREHVTLGIYRRPEVFSVDWLQVPDYCSDRRLRFTLDTQDDLSLLEEIGALLGPGFQEVTAEEVVRIAGERPALLRRMAALNAANRKR